MWSKASQCLLARLLKRDVVASVTIVMLAGSWTKR